MINHTTCAQAVHLHADITHWWLETNMLKLFKQPLVLKFYIRINDKNHEAEKNIYCVYWDFIIWYMNGHFWDWLMKLILL